MNSLESDLEQLKATFAEVISLAHQNVEKSALLERVVRTTKWPDAFFTLYADFDEVTADASKARIRAKPTQLLLDISEAFRTGNLNGLVV
ncbi:hypothetical protein [Vibrio cholerae]|uniref:hypothetical protein n=1 Tax=Vibrio cholerae TaxID=666 RepID=UPI002FDC40BC